jgi:hypothetical protein
MAVKIQLRRGTTTQWNTTVDGIVGGTILAAGEVGVNTTTNQMKVGDGSTRWVNLPYFASGTITNVTAGSGITVNGTIGGSSTSGVTTVAVDTTYVMARSLINAKGDLIVGTANDTPTALSVGLVNTYPLIVNSGVAAGVSWGQIVEAAIATSAVTTTKIADINVTTAKIADSNVTTAKIADINVTTAKIADSNVTLTKLAAAVQSLLVPAGVIVSTLKSTADTGWIALNGTSVTGAQSAYPALYAATSGISGWWSGSTFTPPNMTNKMLEGVGTTTVGQAGGSNTAALAVTNLPAHTHTATDSGHVHTTSASTTLTNGSSVVMTGTGNALLLNGAQGLATYGPYNSAAMSASTSVTVNSGTANVTVSGGGNGTSTGTAFTTTNAHIAVYFQIKAH